MKPNAVKSCLSRHIKLMRALTAVSVGSGRHVSAAQYNKRDLFRRDNNSFVLVRHQLAV